MGNPQALGAKLQFAWPFETRFTLEPHLPPCHTPAAKFVRRFTQFRSTACLELQSQGDFMAVSATTRAGKEVAHPFVRPYVRLMQRNVQLFMQFVGSPKMISLWLKNGQGIINQAFQSAVTGETEDNPGKLAAQAQSNLSELESLGIRKPLQDSCKG
jgi:hypothetical protein